MLSRYVGYLCLHYSQVTLKPQYSQVYVCVCMCYYPYPQEGQPRTASRCYLIFRFGSFSDTSVSYKTLKALWFCRLLSLQREIHLQQDTVGIVFGHVEMQLKPPAGAVTSSVALIKHARLP